MIKSLAILNFQSHEKTKLNFHTGVNVIVGRSDTGKTAILRALRWLSRNRPSGNSIRSTWGGDTNVLIETEEGIVRRVKDKEDKYELSYRGKSGLTFKAFRTDVPEEIVTFLNLNEINLQSQFDAPFLLSNSSGEVAQHFNRVARLDKIDQGLSNVNSAIRSLEQDLKYKEGQEIALQEGLSKFDYLDKMEAEVEVYEELEKRLTTKRNGWDKLKKLIYDLIEVDLDISSYNNLLVLEEQTDKLIWQYGQRQDIQWNRNKLDILLEHIREDTIDLKNLKWVMSFESDVDQIIWWIDQRSTFESQLDAFERDYTKILTVMKKISAGGITIKLMQSQFDKELGETCPLCGQQIKRNDSNK